MSSSRSFSGRRSAGERQRIVTHAIVYYGPFEQNFHLLTSQTTTYVLPSGKQSSVIGRPEGVDGLVFGCMQDGDVYSAVKVADVVVRVPVVIIPGTHTPVKADGKGKQFGPSQYTLIQDAHARRLLDDLIEANFPQREKLGAVWIA